MLSRILSLLNLGGHLARRDPINDPRWKPGVKWQIEIQGPLDQTQPLEPPDAVVWDVDLWHAQRTSVIRNTLKPANKIVICYFSAGTVHNNAGESNDPDLANFTGIALGDPYYKFPEETWINISDPRVLTNMEWRINLAATLGCDGIDPDNIDGYKINATAPGGPKPQNGLGLNQTAYLNYFRSLSTIAKRNNLMIGQKNAPELTPDIVSLADFAVLEECLTSETDENDPLDICDSWQPYIQASPTGKPVFQVEYPRSVQPCDVTEENAEDCEMPILCPQFNMTQDNFTWYCTDEPAPPGPPKSNDTGFSLVMKQDGSTCGLGNWTEYCDVNRVVFVHVLNEEAGKRKRGWKFWG